MRRFLLSSSALLCLSLDSCIGGALYQHTTTPLSVNFDDTPVGVLDGKSDVKDLDLSYLRIMWDGNDIATTARNAGMTEVHYADHERFSILGIWSRDWVHIYGR
jgi:hypothetical protein